jgi:hypothetical protein
MGILPGARRYLAASAARSRKFSLLNSTASRVLQRQSSLHRERAGCTKHRRSCTNCVSNVDALAVCERAVIPGAHAAKGGTPAVDFFCTAKGGERSQVPT